MASKGWAHSFGVEIEQFDTDHRVISDLVVQLDDAVDTGQGRDIVANILSVISEFVRYHVSREQAAFACHHPAHDVLLSKLDEVSALWDAGLYDIVAPVHILRHLITTSDYSTLERNDTGRHHPPSFPQTLAR